MSNFFEVPDTQICSNAKSASDIKASKRFFANPRVTSQPIFESHMLSIKEKILSDRDRVLLNLQDSSSLNFHKHRKIKSDLGHIGSSPNRSDSFGYWFHSSLLIDTSGQCIGVPSQKIWSRSTFNKNVNNNARRAESRKLPIEEKESHKWLEAIYSCKEFSSLSKVIQIADREADIFEFFDQCIENNQGFVVRSKPRRKVLPVESKNSPPIELKKYLESR